MGKCLYCSTKTDKGLAIAKHNQCGNNVKIPLCSKECIDNVFLIRGNGDEMDIEKEPKNLGKANNINDDSNITAIGELSDILEDVNYSALELVLIAAYNSNDIDIIHTICNLLSKGLKERCANLKVLWNDFWDLKYRVFFVTSSTFPTQLISSVSGTDSFYFGSDVQYNYVDGSLMDGTEPRMIDMVEAGITKMILDRYLLLAIKKDANFRYGFQYKYHSLYGRKVLDPRRDVLISTAIAQPLSVSPGKRIRRIESFNDIDLPLEKKHEYISSIKFLSCATILFNIPETLQKIIKSVDLNTELQRDILLRYWKHSFVVLFEKWRKVRGTYNPDNIYKAICPSIFQLGSIFQRQKTHGQQISLTNAELSSDIPLLVVYVIDVVVDRMVFNNTTSVTMIAEMIKLIEANAESFRKTFVITEDLAEYSYDTFITITALVLFKFFDIISNLDNRDVVKNMVDILYSAINPLIEKQDELNLETYNRSLFDRYLKPAQYVLQSVWNKVSTDGDVTLSDTERSVVKTYLKDILKTRTKFDEWLPDIKLNF